MRLLVLRSIAPLSRSQCALATALLVVALCAPSEIVAQQPPAPNSEQHQQQFLELHSRIAWRTLEQGNYPRAELMFRDILRRDPNRPDEIAGLAAAVARQGNIDQAIEVLSDGAQRFPNHATLASALGQAYLNAQNNPLAMDWLERAYELEPATPDINYFLGSAYLGNQFPLNALNVMRGAESSRPEMGWAQDLAIGIAFSQLGLQNQASSYFSRVSNLAAGTPLADNAQELQQQMDNALFGQPFLRGSLKVTQRHDDNPGIVPAANGLLMPLASTPTSGNLYLGQMSYDLLRSYNFDVTLGSTLLHTSNYNAHAFDLMDSGLFLNVGRRNFWRGIPVQSSLRFDYDYMLFGSDEFLQRFIATPSLTLIQTDWSSTTMLARYGLFDFLKQGAFDGTPFDLDSDNLSLGLIHQRRPVGRDATIFGGYLFDHNFSEGSNFDYNGHRLQVGGNWATPINGLRVKLLQEFYYRSYDNPHSIFMINRNDKEYLTEIALLYPLFRDVQMSFSWNFDRNDSNIPTNDYRRHILELGLEYGFPNPGYDQ